MSFDNIVGQSKTKKILKDAITDNRISHAYLFTGNNDLGKSEMAKEFAQTIFCQKKVTDNCGSCLSCRKIKHGNHPDFKIIKVKEGHKNILIDQIRELKKEVNYKPYESKYKVYIIDHAEKMTVQAQNSLLKTLEEPPEYVIIILTNENKNELIPTIISRCQNVKLYNQPVEIVKDYLMKSKNFDEEQAKLYAILSRGKYKKAEKLALKEDFIKTREEIIKLIANINNKDRLEVFESADYLIEVSKNNFFVFELFLSFFRDIIIQKRNGNDDIINFDFEEYIIDSAKDYTTEQIYKLINLVNQYRDYYLKNIKKDLLFPSLLLKIRNKKEL